MIKYFLLFALLLTHSGAVTNYDCSTANNAKVRINQIYNPQTGNETGYLEIYVDNGPVNLEGWSICYGDGSHNRCVAIGSGNGDVYVDGALLGSDADASNIPDNAFVVFDEALFATSGNPENTFAQAKGEAILLDPAGDAAHYLVYHNSNFNTADWDAGAECTTDYTQPTANNNGICATPDFSQPDSQWSYNCDNTMGTYNADPAAPLAEWRMDECLWNGTLSEVKDSKNSHHGTSKALNNDGRVATTFINGVLNRSGEFRGEGYNADPYNAWYTARYYLEVPDHDALSPLSLTQSVHMSITGWFKLNNTGDTHTIVHKGGSSQEYRVFVEAGKLKFTVWDIWGSPKTVTLNTSLAAERFYFFAVTAKGSLLAGSPLEISAVVKNGTSSYTQSGTFLAYTYPLFKTGKLYFGATDWGNITNFLNGYLDEIKLYNTALSSSEIDRLYAYESTGRNYNGASRIPSTCEVSVEEPAVRFDAWDIFRSVDDRNISTKIVGKPFELTVASLDETDTALQDFNGTVCSRIVNAAGVPLSGWVKTLFASQSSAPVSFTLNRAVGGSDSAGVQILWQKEAPAALECDALIDTNTTVASDRFSVRPASFALTAQDAVAGVDFNLTFSAPGFGTSGGSADYNETAGGSFDLQIAEHTPGCLVGTFLPPIDPLSFTNGTKTFLTRYSEVGVLDVNISDRDKRCSSLYTRIDCDDANVSDGTSFTADLLHIGLTQGQIRIKPHHFDVNATFSDFEAGEFTYLSDDLAMSAVLLANVSAHNAQGDVTRNYTQECYAKSTTLTLEHSSVPSPLTRILYRELLSAQESNVTKADNIALDFNASVFTQGSAPFEVHVNFDRDAAKPMNPFDFSLSQASVIDTDGVSGSSAPSGAATFVYGRIRAYDITTDEVSAPNPVEFEVYSTVSGGYVSGMPQNTLYWYRNLNHDTAAKGNVIQGGFGAGLSDPNVDVSSPPRYGLQNVTVSATQDKTVHLDIARWLWYSPTQDYSYSGGCHQHPCFDYDYTGSAAGTPGVSTGTFKGSDFEMQPAKNITTKGVKVFR